MRHWLFSCKKITALISLSMDKELSLYQRMGIRFHLMMCVLCRRYRKQLFFIRSILDHDDSADDQPCKILPDDAHRRIKKKLDEEQE
ncbi:MAG TPA: zf-HC2 domain-containing protein [Desulfocapsa sulfexigens]|nr:zf-HC2 domain-containing protein [Desulfocapsa sulfexigens]